MDLNDPQIADRFLRALEGIQKAMAGIDSSALAIFSKGGPNLEDIQKRLGEVKEGLADIGNQADESVELALSAWSRFEQKIKGTTDELEKSDFIQFLIGKKNDRGGFSGKEGGFASAFQDITRPLTNMTSQLPAAGLLGVLLYGIKKDDEFSAVAQQVAQQLKQVGEAAPVGQVNELGRSIQALEAHSMATRAEVGAVFSALARGSADATVAFAKSSFEVSGFNRTIAETSLGLDKVFQVAAGTSASLARQLVMDTGVGMNKALETVRDMGLAARESGLSFEKFTGSVMNLTGALRMQGVSAGEVAGGFMLMEKALEKFMSGQDKDTRTRRGALTSEGIGGLGGIFNTGNLGLATFLGEDVSKRLGTGVQGIDALIAMQTGFQNIGTVGGMSGGNSRLFGAGLQSAHGLIKGITDDPSEQNFAAQKLFGMNAMQSQLFLNMSKALDGKEGKDLEKALKEFSEKNADALKKVAGEEPLKTSTFETMLKELMLVVSNVGQLLLASLGGLAQITMAGFPYMAEAISNIFKPVENDDAERVFNRVLKDVNENINERFAAVGSSLASLGGTAARAGKQLVPVRTYRDGRPLPTPSEADELDAADAAAVAPPIRTFKKGAAPGKKVSSVTVELNYSEELPAGSYPMSQ